MNHRDYVSPPTHPSSLLTGMLTKSLGCCLLELLLLVALLVEDGDEQGTGNGRRTHEGCEEGAPAKLLDEDRDGNTSEGSPCNSLANDMRYHKLTPLKSGR